MDPVKTISLIGMPGAGKSTVGVILAKLTGLRFTDSDLEIQVGEGATLQQILESSGYQHLRKIEQQVLLNLPLQDAVLSTGGSAVYSEPAMARLAKAGPIIYLQADLDTLQQRVAAAPLRGIASDGKQSFAQVFAERTPLYERFADIVIDTTDGTADEVAARILERIQGIS